MNKARIISKPSIEYTPTRNNFYMPAEWSPHRSTWLSWPTNHDTWVEDIEEVENVFVQMIRELIDGEWVDLLVDSEEEKSRVAEILKDSSIDLSHVVFHVIPTVDVWIRDYGPNFIIGPNMEVAYNRWHFNAWGGKYADLAEDDHVQTKLQTTINKTVYEPKIILEGGSIDVNGRGICLTTEQCLLNPNRNPHLSKDDLETFLKSHLGVMKVIWLNEGIVGDDTDGHVDDISRFVDARTIVTALEQDPNDENHKPLKQNMDILSSQSDRNGRPFRVINLPMPEPVLYKGERLPASYANFYIANKVVLVPTFGCKNDVQALEVLQNVIPDRKVVGIDCSVMVRGLGTLHCASQQEPNGVQ